MIPTIVMQALAREHIEIGSTSTTRDFLFVADTVEGLLRCGETAGIEGEVFNLGTGRETSIAEVIEVVSAAIGRELSVVARDERFRPAGSEVERLCADTSHAGDRLGWAPEVPLEVGLRRTLDWFVDAIDTYKPSLYNV